MKYGNAITIDELQNNIDNKVFMENHLITLEKYFEKFNKIDLRENKLKLFLNGVKIDIQMPADIYRIECNSRVIGTGVVQNNKLKRDVIIYE